MEPVVDPDDDDIIEIIDPEGTCFKFLIDWINRDSIGFSMDYNDGYLLKKNGKWTVELLPEKYTDDGYVFTEKNLDRYEVRFLRPPDLMWEYIRSYIIDQLQPVETDSNLKFNTYIPSHGNEKSTLRRSQIYFRSEDDDMTSEDRHGIISIKSRSLAGAIVAYKDWLQQRLDQDEFVNEYHLWRNIKVKEYTSADPNKWIDLLLDHNSNLLDKVTEDVYFPTGQLTKSARPKKS